MRNKRICHIPALGIATAVILTSTGCLSGCRVHNDPISVGTEAEAEEFMDETSLVQIRNNGIPDFEESMLDETKDTIVYNELDALGRATGVRAVLSAEGMRDKGEPVSHDITTTGFHTVWYETIEKKNGEKGAYLWRHCHLLKSILGGAADDERNFFTGTYTLNNSPGMGAYETQIIKYLKSSNNHVLYRVTPVYEGDNLVASGVILEAESMEDKGKGLQFHVYIRNIEAGIHIDYETGYSYKER